MGRWFQVVVGPLPATFLLLPMLLGGGLGAAFALAAALVEPGRSVPERWASVTSPPLILAWVAAATVGVVALWIVVLAESPAALRQAPTRWWLAIGLCLGLLAAGGWLWVMASGGHTYDRVTWGLWLALLGGPFVLGAYYLAQLVRGPGAA